MNLLARMNQKITREGQIVDVINKRIYPGSIEIEGSKINAIKEHPVQSTQYILPGLVDAHVHIESSMLVPSEFAKIAVLHGTVATVSDPHEIANVLGLAGVNYMIENSETVPFKFYFGAPSCVPATSFESSGATLNAESIHELLTNDKIKYLSEMMNFPGVLSGDSQVMEKLKAARDAEKPVDGHAPGLSGEGIRKYIESGISTDHECFTMEEALEKIAYGMKIQIREGSAAKNFDTLMPLLKSHPDSIMFCSDDKHPDDLLKGHMNLLVKRALFAGYDIFTILRACTVIPINHYKLDVGLLQTGDPADFIVVDNLQDFNIKETFINGFIAAVNGASFIKTEEGPSPNIFNAGKLSISDVAVPPQKEFIRVIRAMEGQLVTRHEIHRAKIENNNVVSDPQRDLLKLVVINRYTPSKPAIGFIRGLGLKNGAMASTVAHDSHNIVAAGANDRDLVLAINQVVESKGGIVFATQDKVHHLPLPVAGIMSTKDGKTLARQYELINAEAISNGASVTAPFMTLSFMALLVIPELKLSDKGLFDGNTFSFIPLFSDAPAEENQSIS